MLQVIKVIKVKLKKSQIDEELTEANSPLRYYQLDISIGQHLSLVFHQYCAAATFFTDSVKLLLLFLRNYNSFVSLETNSNKKQKRIKQNNCYF